MSADKKNYRRLMLVLQSPDDGSKLLKLPYRIRSTELAQQWAQLIARKNSSMIRERTRFQNFGGSDGLDEKFTRVTELLDRLKPLHPELDFGVVDFSDVQAEVNRIHVHFADRHLVKQDLYPESSRYWNDLNVVLHEMESALASAENVAQYSIPLARLVVTYSDSDKVLLTNQDYQDATLALQFGCIYLNYSRVGRHIEELFLSDDLDVPPEHVKLFDRMSQDFYCHFGQTQSHNRHLLELKAMESWFKRNQKFFDRCGLQWDPIRLCIGHLPVAYLEEPLFSVREILTLQKKIARHRFVRSVEIE